MPKHDTGRMLQFFDCEILGARDPRWDGQRLTFERYVVIPREKFWRYWLLAAVVTIFRVKPPESKMTEVVNRGATP